MKCFVAVLGASLVWEGAQAQSYSGAYNGAKQEARNATGTITARENQAVAEPAPASPAPNAPAPNPVLQATLRNVANLRADLGGLGNAADTNAAAGAKANVAERSGRRGFGRQTAAHGRG